jgi:hypothetical protein
VGVSPGFGQNEFSSSHSLPSGEIKKEKPSAGAEDFEVFDGAA